MKLEYQYDSVVKISLEEKINKRKTIVLSVFSKIFPWFAVYLKIKGSNPFYTPDADLGWFKVYGV
jgi:hypothetical protein